MQVEKENLNKNTAVLILMMMTMMAMITAVMMTIMMPSMVMIRKRLEIFGACSPEKVIRRRWILPHRTEASPRWGS